MGRAIAGVIVGYIAMFVFVFASFTVAYMVIGEEGSFNAGTFEVSTTWIVVSLVLGLVAAILGGLVCALIAQAGSKAPTVLAGLVLVLGLLMAIPAFMPPPEDAPTVRTEETTSMEAMMNARQPVLTAVLNPVVGAVGVLIGAAMRGRKKSTGAA